VPKPSDENNEVVASPKHDRRQRRDFTDEYKERILRELDACSERGQVGALLRREGLYSSQISDWRKQLEQGGREGLQAKRPGPKPSKDAKDKQIEQQLKRIAKLEKGKQCMDGCSGTPCARAMERLRVVTGPRSPRPCTRPASTPAQP
jgi:transposase-like protein